MFYIGDAVMNPGGICGTIIELYADEALVRMTITEYDDVIERRYKLSALKNMMIPDVEKMILNNSVEKASQEIHDYYHTCIEPVKEVLQFRCRVCGSTACTVERIPVNGSTYSNYCPVCGVRLK